MNSDYSEHTTLIFGPLRAQLTEALSRKEWARADAICFGIAMELEAIRTHCMRETLRPPLHPSKLQLIPVRKI